MSGVDASLAGTQPAIEKIDVRRVRIICWIAFIAIAIVRAWFTRYEFEGDSVSYLDIARMIAEGHPSAAISAYWSPGYPVLLSIFLWLFRPTPYWECPLAHFVNVLMVAGALASFELFWTEVRRWHKGYAEDYGAEIPETAFWALGYAGFAIANLNVIPVSRVGPDQLMAAFCYLAGWSVLRFRRAPRVTHALMLGLVLGLGYYAKAPLFPMAFIFIVCACFGLPPSRRTILLGVTILVVFLLICAPFIAVLSRAKSRLTFGDAARLSYAFFIDGVQHYEHWQGGPPGFGMPIHPTRKLSGFPEIYEFSDRTMGSYPPWFDPTYWYQGITPHFNWKLQWKVSSANLLLIFQIIIDSAPELICAAIILVLFATHQGRWIRAVEQFWFIWLPGMVALLMFALVHIEVRFLGGCLIMLFAGVVCACWLPASDSTRRAIGYIGLAVLITAGASLVSRVGEEALGADYAPGRSASHAQIAVFLLNNGLKPGDTVAVIGFGSEAYWAHLARLHVVAEIPARITMNQAHPALDFWESGSEQQQKALKILEGTGAKAVIAGSQISPLGSVPSFIPPGWKKIQGTWAYVYFLHDNT